MYRLILLFMGISFANSELTFSDEECLNYTVYPVQYEITIMPYLAKENSYYHCDIKITIIAHASVQVIELDAKDLNIQGGSIKVLDVCKHQSTNADCSRDIVNPARPFEYDGSKGKLYIYLNEPLRVYSPNNAQFYYIQMTFYKHVNEDSKGYFLSKYYDDGEKVWKYMFTSRLSPHQAKYVFPCFDNPKFESGFKFRVYLPPPDGEVQRTNTSLVISQEIKREYARDNMTIIEYMPSPQVRLHQVAFHQSQYSSNQVQAKLTNDTIVVWAPAHELVYYDHILFFGKDIIDLLHVYSTVNRTIVNGPINIVAVPSNLNGYEIGSWNLLTNGVQKIANIDELTSIKQIERMNFELAQQLSRIWLGNPGEDGWTRWKEEWFKEGMATYLAHYLLAQYNFGRHTIDPRPPLGLYGLQMKHKAMAEDWHRSTPALEVFNTTLAIEIPPRYKELVTMKTGALLWMLENWIGSEKFHQALVKYINSRRGKYISLQDFMTSLDKETIECSYQFFNGSTSSRILKSWFRQQGYPVINVQVFRDRIPNAVQLKQRQFSFTAENREDSDYLIPIAYLVQDSANCFNCYQPRFTIGKQTYTFGENLNGGWIILNRNASGYYRVNYDVTTWKLIAKTLKEDLHSISEMNRAQIVNDVLALYVAGDLDQGLAMEILSYLDQEDSHTVWDSAISGFQFMKIDGAACGMTKHIYWEWEKFFSSKSQKILEKLTHITEQQLRLRLFRSQIITFSSEVNNEACLKYLHHLYEEHRAKKQRLNPDTREACYYVLTNDTFSAFNYEKLNAIEQEDKTTAEHKVREKNRYFIKIPLGVPSPERYVMPTESPSTAVTEGLSSVPGSSGNNMASLIIICVTTVIINIIY